MNIKYDKPTWIGGKGVNYTAITDKELDNMQSAMKRVQSANEAKYLAAQDRRATLLRECSEFFGANTNIVNAIKSTYTPKPPDFSNEWKKMESEVLKARKRVKAEQQRQLRLAEDRARRRERAAEQRRLAIERAEYVENMPQSD